MKKVKKSQDKFKNISQFFNMCIGKNVLQIFQKEVLQNKL